MKNSRLAASFFGAFAALSGGACGPAESLPPSNDAGMDQDAGDAGVTCVGLCAPYITAGWSAPFIAWMGAKAAAPPCPVVNAAAEIYTGFGDPEGSACGACKCQAPLGSCKAPPAVTAAAASCAGDGSAVAHTSFDPPISWDGTCTTANAIPAGKLCGGVPCVQSVTIAPLTLKQGGCLPIEPTNVPPPIWKTFVRACALDSFPRTCDAAAGLCAPRPPNAEFKVCTLRNGNPATLTCPPTYPDKNVFYDGLAPSCSPCTCGVPTDSTCTGSIWLFENGACGAPPLQAVKINAEGPTCADLPPGSALGSKTASEPSYSDGYCKPSGGAALATVICCIP